MNIKPTYIACGLCVNYFVTYDKKRPRGCKKFGFKSSQSPSLEVFSATGTNCAHYEHKLRPLKVLDAKLARRIK
jgi:hypothetical protein